MRFALMEIISNRLTMNFLIILAFFTLNMAFANSQLRCRVRMSKSNTFLVIMRF